MGHSFGKMMDMMMKQYKNVSEQRDREYQFLRDEMAVTRKKAREQMQKMNLMVTANVE